MMDLRIYYSRGDYGTELEQGIVRQGIFRQGILWQGICWQGIYYGKVHHGREYDGRVYYGMRKLETCKTKVTFDYRVRKLSAGSTTCIPLAL